MSIHDEDVLGKALRRAVDAASARATCGRYRASGGWRRLPSSPIRRCELAPPYLVKLVIDRYIPARDITGLVVHRRAVPRDACRILRPRLRADAGLLQLTGQRIMFDLRMADLRAPAAARPALLRPQSGRPADDARHDRRRRPERPVHVRRRVGLRRSCSRSSASWR